MTAPDRQAKVTIVVGAQWGDEGKGKWVDIFAEDAEIVARYQGGNNAGHTLFIEGTKYVLHQIPSGIFRKNQTCALASGVVVNPAELVREIEKVKATAEVTPERLWLSARAHVISPWHVHLDGLKENQAKEAIGTTKRGIGPTYSEKAARTGLRMGHFVNQEARDLWVDHMRDSDKSFAEFFKNSAAQWQEFFSAAAALAPFVCDAESRLRAAIKSGKKILLEGAQGTLLDLDHGTYPFVTSSSTAASGACTSIGMSPKAVTNIYGIGKAYVTRVGSGPFPTELFDEAGKHMATLGKEFGATTGRPRRCGWFDAVAMRYAIDVNGFDGIILNKMDILTGLRELKIAVAYQHPRLGTIYELPWDAGVLKDCTPVYETLPGWIEPIPASGRIADLPAAARAYVAAVEKACNCKVMMVGTGPNRHEALYS